MTDADRKLAGACVLTAWAVALCAVGSAILSDSFARTHAEDKTQSVVLAVPQTEPNVIQEAALVLERESHCLAQAVYYEARGESAAGQLAVAEVVMNRVRDGGFADTICGVVFQGAQRVTGCQFSFTCDGSLDKPLLDQVAWRRAERLARNVVMGHAKNLVGTATHYHANYVDPYWAASLEKKAQIGRHIFYSEPGTVSASAAPRG